jgi:hypothetical protein
METLKKVMEPHTAGDPISGIKWSRKSTRAISEELKRQGHGVCARTVSRLLQSDELGYSLKRNVKAIAGQRHPQRNRQFRQIQQKIDRFRRLGRPVLSLDCKKKELVGNFLNAGQAWRQEPIAVNDHDFPDPDVPKAVPYGIYDVLRNRGVVVVGTSAETAAFAVDALRTWRGLEDGQLSAHYADPDHVLVLVDNGGANGSRSRLWKRQLQKLANRLGVSFTVAHYPPGASKWNPIEHRLFSFISGNWAGQPLTDYPTILNFIRTTRTQTGLRVKAVLLDKRYKTGLQVTDEEYRQIRLRPGRVLPKWNYTIRPAQN